MAERSKLPAKENGAREEALKKKCYNISGRCLMISGNLEASKKEKESPPTISATQSKAEISPRLHTTAQFVSTPHPEQHCHEEADVSEHKQSPSEESPCDIQNVFKDVDQCIGKCTHEAEKKHASSHRRK